MRVAFLSSEFSSRKYGERKSTLRPFSITYEAVFTMAESRTPCPRSAMQRKVDVLVIRDLNDSSDERKKPVLLVMAPTMP
jgi:hypothetical protein